MRQPRQAALEQGRWELMRTGAMADLAASAARRYGDKPAIRVPGGRSLSFSELDAAAARFAGGLLRLGAARGESVVLHLPNSIEWVIAYHAIARIGAVVVPANVLLSAAEVAFITDNSGAKL